MPALLPPSMQISGIAPGVGTGGGIPGNFPAPLQTGLLNPAVPVIIQNVGAATNVSGPTNISLTVPATRQGSTLIWGVSVNASAGAALGGAPTGFTLITSQTVATLAAGLYVQQNCPSGITTVTFSSNATATTGGIACFYFELGGVISVDLNASANGNSVSPASGNVTPVAPPAFLVGMNAGVAGQALTAPGGGWQNFTQQTSTNGTTNAIIQLGTNQRTFSTPVAIGYSGGFAGAVVWVSAILSLGTNAAENANTSVAGLTIDQGAGYASTQDGSPGWAVGAVAKAGGNGLGF